MPLPDIDEANRKKPLGYDPRQKRFIYYDDLLSGKEPVVSVDSLSLQDLKKLVIERQRAGPDYRLASLGGPYTRDDVIHAIEQDDPLGRETVEAEKAYLRDLLTEIRTNLK